MWRKYLKHLRNTAKGVDYLLIYLVYKTGLRGSITRMPKWLPYLCGGLILVAPAVVWTAGYLAARLVAGRLIAAALATLGLATFYRLLTLGRHRLFHIPMYDAGSARQLRGRCAVFEIYVGRKWTRRKRRQGRRSLRAACRWLEQTAAAHGVELSMVDEPADVLRLPDHVRRTRGLGFNFMLPNPRRAEIARDVARVTAGAIQERLLDLPGDFDNHLLVVHLKRQAVGFAVPARNRLANRIELELCLCSSTSSPATYAHEILHLFGARDLYCSRELAQATSRWLDDDEDRRVHLYQGFDAFWAKFPRALMAATDEPLDALEISPLTAHAVGWPQPASIRAGEAKKYEDAAGVAFDIAIGFLAEADDASLTPTASVQCGRSRRLNEAVPYVKRHDCP